MLTSSINLIRSISLNIHIWLGFILLASFWLILLVKKGTRNHSILGNTYNFSALVICLTSIINSSLFFIFPSQMPTNAINHNIMFLTTASFVNLIYIARSHAFINYQSDLEKVLSPTMYLLHILSLILAIASIFFFSNLLIPTFWIIVSTYLLLELLFLSRVIRNKNYSSKFYLYWHINSGLAGSIGMHASFLAGGAQSRYFSFVPEQWKWHFFGSLVMFLTIIKWFYLKKLQKKLFLKPGEVYFKF